MELLAGLKPLAGSQPETPFHLHPYPTAQLPLVVEGNFTSEYWATPPCPFFNIHLLQNA